MTFESVAQQMIIMFLAMALGYLARKCRLMNDEFDRGLSELVLGITLPCMLLASVLNGDTLPDTATMGQLFGYSTAAFLIMLPIAFIAPILLRVPKEKRGVYRFAVIFGNVGFVGIPVLSSIFGPGEVLYVAILNIPFNLFVFTLGIMLIAGNQGGTLKERAVQTVHTLRTPTMISCVATVIFALVGIQGIPILGPALQTVGDMTTPAALLIIGSSLAKMPLRQAVGNPRAWAIAVVRVVVVPFALFAVFSQFVVDAPMLLGALVITNGMPVATNGTLFCIRYGGDLTTMTQATFVSTIMSLVSIPFVTTLIV